MTVQVSHGRWPRCLLPCPASSTTPTAFPRPFIPQPALPMAPQNSPKASTLHVEWDFAAPVVRTRTGVLLLGNPVSTASLGSQGPCLLSGRRDLSLERPRHSTGAVPRQKPFRFASATSPCRCVSAKTSLAGRAPLHHDRLSVHWKGTPEHRDLIYLDCQTGAVLIYQKA